MGQLVFQRLFYHHMAGQLQGHSDFKNRLFTYTDGQLSFFLPPSNLCLMFVYVCFVTDFLLTQMVSCLSFCSPHICFWCLCMYVLFYIWVGIDLVDLAVKEKGFRSNCEKSFKTYVCLWQSLIVLRQPCAADRTSRSTHSLSACVRLLKKHHQQQHIKHKTEARREQCKYLFKKRLGWYNHT